MNFLCQGFRKLLSNRQTHAYRQRESTEILNHAASRVVKKLYTVLTFRNDDTISQLPPTTYHDFLILTVLYPFCETLFRELSHIVCFI